MLHQLIKGHKNSDFAHHLMTAHTWHKKYQNDKMSSHFLEICAFEFWHMRFIVICALIYAQPNANSYRRALLSFERGTLSRISAILLAPLVKALRSNPYTDKRLPILV